MQNLFLQNQSNVNFKICIDENPQKFLCTLCPLLVVGQEKVPEKNLFFLIYIFQQQIFF